MILAGIIASFSVLTTAELAIVKWLGFDVIAHLETTAQGGGWQFYLEAFGAVAFIVGQPIVFMILLIISVRKIGPLIMQSVMSIME